MPTEADAVMPPSIETARGTHIFELHLAVQPDADRRHAVIVVVVVVVVVIMPVPCS